MKKFALNQLPALIWIGIIFWLSSLHRLPNLHIPMADKIAHTSFYAVLCGLWFRAFSMQEKFPKLRECALCAAWLFTILYGLTDEVHQLYVWGRSSDVLDIVADSFGGFLFVLAFMLYRKWKPETPSGKAQEARV